MRGGEQKKHPKNHTGPILLYALMQGTTSLTWSYTHASGLWWTWVKVIIIKQQRDIFKEPWEPTRS